MKIIVTGGSGFIGSALVRILINETAHHVVNIDRMTYAANDRSLSVVANHPRYEFLQLDIGDDRISEAVRDIFPDVILNLAAESHVDRSISGPANFIQSNIYGTYNLIQHTREWIQDNRREVAKKRFRFIHISTDEVYGSLGFEDKPFHEKSRYKPNSPYSASKASSDHLVRAWNRTYNFPAIITNCSNNYGPYQNPEKLIPKTITNMIRGKDCPLYGSGENIRDWIHVEDHCRALILLMEAGKLGHTYCIGGDCEVSNQEMVNKIASIMDERRPRAMGHAPLIRKVNDRPGHDLRYAVNSDKIRRLGWEPKIPFGEGLEETVLWYLENQDWWKRQ